MRAKYVDSGSFCSSESARLHWPNLLRNFRSHFARINFNHEIEWAVVHRTLHVDYSKQHRLLRQRCFLLTLILKATVQRHL